MRKKEKLAIKSQSGEKTGCAERRVTPCRLVDMSWSLLDDMGAKSRQGHGRMELRWQMPEGCKGGS